ncbi:DUF2946 family protein [Paeniroseomonas aquatica]|uniref:DUF2946 family protein n=1 Tax=Paeniroseomonas aquatica TaxID=373043 RepID=A0ABT8AE91_9PROT|nr:DUF2946 family protein [Paeniroseomonas aquatica]MDN3567781.1 DUF2946 family protein [Paeniroseomonas aquatica]
MIHRLPAPLRRLLAAVLLLQAVLAPSLYLAAGQATLAVEICTAEGLRTLHAAPDGTPAGPGHDGACQACHALPQGADLALPALPAPAWVALAAPAAAPASLPSGIRGPPGGARAPPALS